MLDGVIECVLRNSLYFRVFFPTPCFDHVLYLTALPLSSYLLVAVVGHIKIFVV